MVTGETRPLGLAVGLTQEQLVQNFALAREEFADVGEKGEPGLAYMDCRRDQGQIVVRYGRERSGKLTPWPRSGGAGDRTGQGVDGECPDDEEGESSSGEHDDTERCEEEQITAAPGLKFGR